jgi:arylsulfatase A
VTDRTLVVFTSDNGPTHEGRAESRFHIGGADPKFFNSAAGLRGYKGSVYEGGLRVPMIARLPGLIAAGAVNDTPGTFADWFPTLCDAVGLTQPGGLDGQSLWPVLTGQSPGLGARKPMIWVFPEYGGQVAVRMGDFKVVRQGLKTKKPGAWEVYDLAQDRGETNDLAATRSDLIRQVKELLRREVSENELFPVPIPGVNEDGE